MKKLFTDPEVDVYQLSVEDQIFSSGILNLKDFEGEEDDLT